MTDEKKRGSIQDDGEEKAARKSSYKDPDLDNLEESTNPYYEDWAKKFATEPGEGTDDRPDTKEKMTTRVWTP